MVFYGSPYEVNPCWQRFGLALAMFISITYGINYVAFMGTLYPYAFVVMIAGAITFILLIYSQILAFVFVRKLYKLNTMATRDDNLIAAMTRYCTMCEFTIRI